MLKSNAVLKYAKFVKEQQFKFYLSKKKMKKVVELNLFHNFVESKYKFKLYLDSSNVKFNSIR